VEEIDRKILLLLAHDGRMSFTDLARQTGLSVSATHQRVRRLERRGMIRGYAAVINPAESGLPLTAFVSIKPFDPAAADDAPERLVAGDHRQPAGAHGALVLLDVAAADAARLDSQQRAVLGADNRAGKLAYLHLPGAGLDHGANHVSHVVLYSPFRGLRGGMGQQPSPDPGITIYDTWRDEKRVI